MTPRRIRSLRFASSAGVALAISAFGCRPSEAQVDRVPPSTATHSTPSTVLREAPPAATTTPPRANPAASAPAVAATRPKARAEVDSKTHAWSFSPSAERLEARFPPPQGFTPAPGEPGSFAEFARGLPMAPPDAKVVDYRGAPLYEGGYHDGIAAVVDIDVGTRDLQQCADAVLRLNAEWRYGRSDRDMKYRAVSGTPMAYSAYLKGERSVVEGGKMTLKTIAKRSVDEHAVFRAYLDQVFGWANTTSIEREGTRVPFAEVRAGDYFVMPGSPFGHAVVVLDVAHDGAGRTALLLGQSYMPAQSFHILRPSKESTWFVVKADAREVATPFWAPFPLESLRRLP